MPFTHRIDAEAGILFLTGEGVVTQQERLAAFHAWLTDPAFRPGLDAFCDFTRAESTPELAELKTLLAVVKQHALEIGRCRVAMLTAKPVTFGVARQFEALSGDSPLEVRAFRDRGEAMRWLRGPASTETEV